MKELIQDTINKPLYLTAMGRLPKGVITKVEIGDIISVVYMHSKDAITFDVGIYVDTELMGEHDTKLSHIKFRFVFFTLGSVLKLFGKYYTTYNTTRRIYDSKTGVIMTS